MEKKFQKSLKTDKYYQGGNGNSAVMVNWYRQVYAGEGKQIYVDKRDPKRHHSKVETDSKKTIPAPAVMVKPGQLEDIDAALELELVPQGHQVAECSCLLGNVCICICFMSVTSIILFLYL